MAAEPIERLFCSTSEAAKALGVSGQHVRDMIERGELKGTRLGTKILVPIAELRRLAGEPIETAHEDVSSRNEREEKIRELRQVLARAQTLLADLEE